MKRMYYDIPDWEHDGDTDSELSRLKRMGATNTKVIKIRFDDPDYDDDDEEAYEVTIALDVRESYIKKFEDYGCY